MDSEKEKISLEGKIKMLKLLSPEENIQIVKLLLSFAIRLISIVGEYEFNQNLIKRSKEIKLANFLVAYNFLDNFISNDEMNCIYPFRIFNGHQQNVEITFDGDIEKNFKSNFETLRKLFLKRYTIREWIEFVENIYSKHNDFGYFVGTIESKQRKKNTHNSQNPLDLLMVAWTGRTTIDYDSYAFFALKNFGINMAKLLLRNSTTNGLDKFPAFKKDLVDMEKSMEDEMATYKTKFTQGNEYWKDRFNYHYEDAIIFGQTLSEEYNEIVKKTEKIILDCKENIENCIENKYKEMAEEVEDNIIIIRKLNKNIRLWELIRKYSKKLRKFMNLTKGIKDQQEPCTNLSRYLPAAFLSSEKKSARKIFKENKKKWKIKKAELKGLMEEILLEILK